MDAGQKLVIQLQKDDEYRNRFLHRIVEGITKTPSALNITDFRMLKDYPIKEALSLDSRLNMKSIDGESFDIRECKYGARISIKIQKEIFPRKKKNTNGMTSFKPIMLKNTMSESNKTNQEYKPGFDLLVAIQPPLSSNEPVITIGMMTASYLMKHEKRLIVRTNHNWKLMPSDVSDWSGIYQRKAISTVPNEVLNKIFYKTAGPGGDLWKLLLTATK